MSGSDFSPGSSGADPAQARQTPQTIDWDALIAEVRERGARPADRAAIARCEALYEQACADADHATGASRTNLLIELALFHFYATSESRNAIAPANMAVRIAEATGIATLLRRALTVYGIVCADTTDVGMAIQCYVRALALATQLGELPALCSVWLNLGSALSVTAAYEDAIQCFENAITLSAGSDDPVVVQIALSARGNIALGYLHLERHDEGIRAIEAALAISHKPEAQYQIVGITLLEYTYTRLLLAAGRIAEARVRAERALAYVGEQPVPRAAVAAHNAIGLVEVFEGRFEGGMRRLTSSLERSRSLKAAHRDTLIALVMANERANRIDEALAYQRELLAHTSQALKANIRVHEDFNLRQLVSRVHAGAAESVARRHFDQLSEDNVQHGKTLEQIETLERIAVNVSMREDPSGAHPYRVARLASLLAEEAGIDQQICRTLDIAARLHDIGNICIPDRIMLSARSLSDEERALVQTHAVMGAELLENHDIPEVIVAGRIARSHHERWDGSGYPDHLAGEDIPLVARLTAIAEVFDALTHRRAHRPAIPPDEALQRIAAGAGTAFDPRLSQLFVTLMQRLLATHPDIDRLLSAGAHSSMYLQARSEVATLLGAGQRGTVQ